MSTPRLSRWVHILFSIAAIWGLVAGLAIFFIPFGMRVTETVTSSGSGEVVAAPISFLDMQGWWGIWILVAFATLYYGPLHFYRRGFLALTVLFAAAAIILAFLAGFSVGPFYLPAALVLFLGLALLPFSTK